MLPSPDPRHRFLFYGRSVFTFLPRTLPPLPSPLTTSALPSSQLFYLCADVCQQAAAKDSRGLGKEIWNIFLERNAVRKRGCEPAWGGEAAAEPASHVGVTSLAQGPFL